MAIKELSYGLTTQNVNAAKDILPWGDIHLEKGELTKVKTALKGFDVFYRQEGITAEFYLFSKNGGPCMGLFEAEAFKGSLKYTTFLKSKTTKVITPHMLLAEEFRGQKIAPFIYASFLSGNRVFATFKHTLAAKNLWDAMAANVPGLVSFYVDVQTGKIVDESAKQTVFRVLGRGALFNSIETL